MSLYEIENPKTTTGARSTLRQPACQTYPLCSHKVCDKSLSIRERVAALVKDLTMEEKILNIVDGSAGAARLGLPSHEWWNEATHGVGSAPGVLFPGTGPEFNYATSFPSPITSAASFDDELFRAIGEVVGKEKRQPLHLAEEGALDGDVLHVGRLRELKQLGRAGLVGGGEVEVVAVDEDLEGARGALRVGGAELDGVQFYLAGEANSSVRFFSSKAWGR